MTEFVDRRRGPSPAEVELMGATLDEKVGTLLKRTAALAAADARQKTWRLAGLVLGLVLTLVLGGMGWLLLEARGDQEAACRELQVVRSYVQAQRDIESTNPFIDNKVRNPRLAAADAFLRESRDC